MTKNQIEFWSLQERRLANERNWKETSRSNRAKEVETNRHNLETERFNSRNLLETSRANKVREAETERSNRAREQETWRHNYSTEKENIRHNVVSESELNRHNLTSESLSKQQLDELGRHNLAVEGETARSNRASEALGYASNRVNAARVAEESLHNRNTEGLTQSQQELVRYQTDTNAALKQQEINQAETKIDISAAQHSETVRHNLRTEELEGAKTVTGVGGTLISTLGRVMSSMWRK